MQQNQMNNLSSVNLGYCKKIILAQLSGTTILPYRQGLNNAEYQQLIKTINDPELIQKEQEWHSDDWLFIRERAALCNELFAMKEEERQELINLLDSYRNKQDPFAKTMAIMIATACLAKFHLWESLGLSDRTQLGKIIAYNFPELYALNNKNMRWKRFFYLQLCKQGGDYICRAPSCEECKSYSECFINT